MASCRLSVRSFVLEVWSWSGNDVPINLYRMNAILCPDKKGQSPTVQFSPSQVPVLAKRRQISVEGAGSTPCPAVIPEGARLSTQLAPSLLRRTKGGDQVSQTMTRQMVIAIRSHRGEVPTASRPGTRLMALVRALEPFRTVPNLFPEPFCSPAGPTRIGKLKGLQEKA